MVKFPSRSSGTPPVYKESDRKKTRPERERTRDRDSEASRAASRPRRPKPGLSQRTQHSNGVDKFKEMKPPSKMPELSVNLGRLEMATLRKYKRHFRLPARTSVTKEELVSDVARHFAAYRVDEVRTIKSFVRVLKHIRGSRFDSSMSETF
mmetsp:Transcript_33510/g.76598  ORF Transcript_33510/g.76598 Transcript_33510/m.76598 type:complete len:151 (-) Transcript_33510:163-615(-)